MVNAMVTLAGLTVYGTSVHDTLECVPSAVRKEGGVAVRKKLPLHDYKP